MWVNGASLTTAISVRPYLFIMSLDSGLISFCPASVNNGKYCNENVQFSFNLLVVQGSIALQSFSWRILSFFYIELIVSWPLTTLTTLPLTTVISVRPYLFIMSLDSGLISLCPASLNNGEYCNENVQFSFNLLVVQGSIALQSFSWRILSFLIELIVSWPLESHMKTNVLLQSAAMSGVEKVILKFLSSATCVGRPTSFCGVLFGYFDSFVITKLSELPRLDCSQEKLQMRF